MFGIVDARQLPSRKILAGAPESGVKIEYLPTEETASLSNYPTKSAELRSKVKEEGDLVTLTIKFPTWGEEWIIPLTEISVYNAEGYFKTFDFNTWDEEGNELKVNSIDVEVPPGKYDILGIFQKIDPTQYGGCGHEVYYISENIEVSDGSVAELKPWESTVCLSVEPTIPDGDNIKLRKIRYLNENWEWELIEEGNVSTMLGEKIFYLEGIPIMGLLVGFNIAGVLILPTEDGSYPLGQLNGQEYINIYVNKVSDRYSFREIWTTTSWPDENTGMYMAVIDIPNPTEGSYFNNPNYTLDDRVIDSTPLSKLYPPMDEEREMARPYEVVYSSYANGTNDYTTLSISSQYKGLWNVFYAGPATPFNTDDLYLSYKKILYDAYVPKEYKWGTYYFKYTTKGPLQYPFVKGGNEVAVYAYKELNTNGNSLNPYPGNETFLFPLDKLSMSGGDSAPLLTLYNCPSISCAEDGESFYYMTPYFYYTGRIGESLGSTEAFASVSLSIDGAIVAENMNDVEELCAKNHDTPGKYELNISTDNFEIDGIMGGNRAYISYDNLNEDSMPPSVTMLQFRNSEGDVTQRFSNTENTEILLSAADFIICVGEVDEYGDIPEWLGCSEPAEVRATCVPTGSMGELFDTIELAVVPEAFMEHGFGAFYRGSLKDVTLESPTGWYDLTLFVKDAAGNSQKQTLSPAFYIDSLTGVKSLTSDSSVRVNGNTIIAPEGSRVFNINGIETGTDNLPVGIYIVSTPTGKTKIVVK